MTQEDEITDSPPVRAEIGWPQGDAPGRLEFGAPVPAALAQALVGAVSEPLRIDARDANAFALTEPDGAIGRYRIELAKMTYFVRVSADWGDPITEDALIRYLANGGIACNGFLACGVRFRWAEKDLRLDVRPFLGEARHFDPEGQDLAPLARTLRCCHDMLREFPGAETIRHTARKRYEKLDRVAAEIARAAAEQRWSWFRELGDWATERREWLAAFTPELAGLVERPESQCIHGEIHRANVFFDLATGEAVLLDFEESVRHFVPPAWDLAYLVQRFCLHDDPTAETLRERLRIIQAVYGGKLPPLGDWMELICRFLICIIVDLCLSDRVLKPVAECEKFYRMANQAREFKRSEPGA